MKYTSGHLQLFPSLQTRAAIMKYADMNVMCNLSYNYSSSQMVSKANTVRCGSTGVKFTGFVPQGHTNTTI